MGFCSPKPTKASCTRDVCRWHLTSSQCTRHRWKKPDEERFPVNYHIRWLMATLGAYCLLAMEKESEKAPFSGEIVFDRLLLEGTRMIPHRLVEAGDL